MGVGENIAFLLYLFQNSVNRDAEFDRFLSERAAAGDRLPNTPSRQGKGKEPQESSLFAL